MRQAQVVKRGVAAGGATPREFCTITVTDGIAMGHAGMKASLPSREVIADSVELTVRGHAYDALIGIAGCDKSQPGMMMAMCRLNVPAIYIYGGIDFARHLQRQAGHHPGRLRGGRKTFRRADVRRRSRHSRTECLPIGGRMRRAIYRQHDGDGIGSHRSRAAILGWRAGALRDPRQVLHARRRNDHGRDPEETFARATSSRARRWRTPRRLLRQPADRRMQRCIYRRSRTNAVSSSRCFEVAEVFKKTPYVADLKPGGRYVAKDMFEAGGVPLLMKTLLDHGYLHGDCLTVTGRTIAENLKNVKWNPDQDVVRPATSLCCRPAVSSAQRNLAPDARS